MLTKNVEVQIIVSLESNVAMATDEWFFFYVSSHVTLDVWFSWKTFPTNVAIKWFAVFMKPLVETPKFLNFKVLGAEAARERTINRMCHRMAIQIFLSFETF